MTGYLTRHPARRPGVRSTAGRRQVHERSISGPRGALSLSRGLARGRARKSWPPVSGTGGAGGVTRRACAPALRARGAAGCGFTCLPSGALLPRRRAVRHCVRLRLHGGVMKGAGRSFESLAALAKAGRPRPGNGNSRRHVSAAVLGKDNRPGGRRPRGTIGDATAPHAPRRRSPVSRTP